MSDPRDGDRDRARRVDLDHVVRTARRLGVEFDHAEAARWMAAVEAASGAGGFAHDPETGVFGHAASLEDFDTRAFPYFCRLADHVRVSRRPHVESAIAIAGSAAQGRVQIFPGDYDFFERANIKAETLDGAKRTLREILRETALRGVADGDGLLVEANFGVYRSAVTERGVARAPGDPITWTPRDVERGWIDVQDAAGRTLTIRWDEIDPGPGWTYAGWIVVDRERRRIALASNMLEVTWESPSGDVVALDGSSDPCFQEIYLERDALPLVAKLTASAKGDALGAYVSAMRRQAFHYTHGECDFCKASKRLYNLFRLTGEFKAAAYVRELFDEPGACVYQVPGMLDAAAIALNESSAIDRDIIVEQIDRVIQAIVDGTGAAVETDLVNDVGRLRAAVGDASSTIWAEVLPDVRRRAGRIASEYFRVRLLALPRIAEVIATLWE